MTQNSPPPRIHVLTKPTGSICNLAYSYCFFLAKEALYPGSRFRMSDEVLENYIRQLIAAHRTNADYPLEVYRFLRDEAGTDWIQFIPVVERINNGGHTLYQKGDTVSGRFVKPEQFGSFLSSIFDEWVRTDVGRVCAQTFEASARIWLWLPSGMCVFEETCGMGLALEHIDFPMQIMAGLIRRGYPAAAD